MDARPVRLEGIIALFVALAMVAIGCAGDAAQNAGSTCLDDPGDAAIQRSQDDLAGTTIRLATHDSFVVSKEKLSQFTELTGIAIEHVAIGDAGALVSQAILTKESPTADVIFGIDNTFLCRGLEAGIFLRYRAAHLDNVDDALVLDPFHRVTPIDYGDVCVNYWLDALPGPVPTTLDDLVDPTNAGEFVTPNPETSSPGFAFLLASIAEYGDDWERYWADLVANDVVVTAGWNDAYYGDFIAGGGERSMVTSYATSPPAEVIFADPPVDVAPTGFIEASCFRQIEFAGIVAGTKHPEAAAEVLEFMLSRSFQEDIPLNMFVYPANSTVDLPPEFIEHGSLVDDALILDPVEIEANRDDWTARWTDIVMG